MGYFFNEMEEAENRKAESFLKSKNIEFNKENKEYIEIFCKAVVEVALSYHHYDTTNLRYDLQTINKTGQQNLKNMVNAHKLVCRMR